MIHLNFVNTNIEQVHSTFWQICYISQIQLLSYSVRQLFHTCSLLKPLVLHLQCALSAHDITSNFTENPESIRIELPLLPTLTHLTLTHLSALVTMFSASSPVIIGKLSMIQSQQFYSWDIVRHQVLHFSLIIAISIETECRFSHGKKNTCLTSLLPLVIAPFLSPLLKKLLLKVFLHFDSSSPPPMIPLIDSHH